MITIHEKIEAIRKAVIEANPDIMKLEFGCEISCNDYKKPSIRQYAGWKWNRETEEKIMQVIDSHSQLFPFDENYEILGRKIGLADVVLVFKKRLFDKPGRPGSRAKKETTVLQAVWKWNCQKDDLLLQDKITVDSLYQLLIQGEK